MCPIIHSESNSESQPDSKPGKASLFIATSLDGFIAGPDGDLSFLQPFQESGIDYGYETFFGEVGTVVLGRKSYQKVLSFGDPFPYSGKRVFVISSLGVAIPDSLIDLVRVINGSAQQLWEKISDGPKGKIFIDGGGETIRFFLSAGLIGDLSLFLMPVLLGTGIPLFQNDSVLQIGCKLLSCTHFKDGVVRLDYQFIDSFPD